MLRLTCCSDRHTEKNRQRRRGFIHLLAESRPSFRLAPAIDGRSSFPETFCDIATHLRTSCTTSTKHLPSPSDRDSLRQSLGCRFQASTRASCRHMHRRCEANTRVDPSRRRTDTWCEVKARRVEPSRMHTDRHPLRSKTSTTLA